MNLNDKVCLITGGTRGIGAATALAAAQEGAKIALVARHDDEEAKATKTRIEARGAPCELVLADCARPEQIARAIEQVTTALGRVDVLVHSAGGPVNGRLLEITPEAWYGAFDVHVHAVFHLARALVPQMRERKEGAILLISSAAGIRGVHTHIAYQTVKGTLPQMTRALARELADDNIRVNCVAPGVIRTRFHSAMTVEQKQLNLEHRIPLHREGTSEQVASLILELIQNDYITGETMIIDGGLTMRIA